jgi:hypothetical protein
MAFRMAKGEVQTNILYQNERPFSVRQRKTEIRSRVNGDLHLEFTATGLTSYAGLELLIRYFRSIDLNGLIRRHLGGLGLVGDYGIVAMVRLLLGLLIVGGCRLRHVGFLAGDPLLMRFCALRQLPSARTISRWLKQFRMTTVRRLADLNAEIVAAGIRQLPLRTLTLDVDGSVVSTGLKVERAFRGFNPHQRKVPSYYPITAHVGESSHMFRVKNRSGNVHDGKKSLPFLRDVFRQVEQTLGPVYRLDFRMDGAFFQQEVIRLLQDRGAGFAIKVPFWHWLDLQRLIRERKRWQRVGAGLDAFEQELPVSGWGLTLRVMIYRKRVHHLSQKNYQLDLFDPSDGYYEYSAVTTNLSWDAVRLWRFMSGRGAQEKVIGELKDGLAFDSVPTNRYGANSAWQQVVVVAYNLLLNFQLATGAVVRGRTQKRTAMPFLKRIKTLRFELFNRAGQMVRPNGRTILRLTSNQQIEMLFRRAAETLNIRKAA